MTGPEHYAEAERLAELAMSPAGLGVTQDGFDVAGTALVHATLALAAATVDAAGFGQPGEVRNETAWTAVTQ